MIEPATFCFKHVSCVFLYGDNFIARKLLGSLRKSDYFVKAIIDRRYKTLQKEADGLELLSLDLLHENIKDAVVVICLASGLTHESVLSDLIKKGFENIIYLPMLTNRPLLEQEVIRRAYLDITAGNFDAISSIPKTISLSKNDTIIIFENTKQTSFLCPVQLLHTATEKTLQTDVLPDRESLTRQFVKDCLELPLENLIPYRQLFSYLMGNGDYPKVYLDWLRNTEEEKKELLENRKQLLQVYEQNYEYNFSFFLYSPARAEWNKKGYINICDGLHRCIYLMMKGKKMVPVVMQNDDYMAYKQYKKGK
ncbi:MAG: hypothetical protein ACI4LX_05630 [Treponema sp.]